ncbi:hypothetical protein HY772_07650 [Candidatus Woesearchaeota archaeon]|nr:hypothetical protein [Candidatus Woesearchaeota archaeon]
MKTKTIKTIQKKVCWSGFSNLNEGLPNLKRSFKSCQVAASVHSQFQFRSRRLLIFALNDVEK